MVATIELFFWFRHIGQSTGNAHYNKANYSPDQLWNQHLRARDITNMCSKLSSASHKVAGISTTNSTLKPGALAEKLLGASDRIAAYKKLLDMIRSSPAKVLIKLSSENAELLRRLSDDLLSSIYMNMATTLMGTSCEIENSKLLLSMARFTPKDSSEGTSVALNWFADGRKLPTIQSQLVLESHQGGFQSWGGGLMVAIQSIQKQRFP
jgi:hypothetical protein